MHIQHNGSYTFSLPKDSIHLSHIFHVPMFTKILLSLSQLLHDNDLTIEFSSNSCVFKDRHTNITLVQDKSINSLYSFTLPLFSDSLSLLKPLLMNMCQLTFGMQALAALLPLQHSTTLHLLNAYQLTFSSKFLFCDDCSMAKAHKLPFYVFYFYFSCIS